MSQYYQHPYVSNGESKSYFTSLRNFMVHWMYTCIGFTRMKMWQEYLWSWIMVNAIMQIFISSRNTIALFISTLGKVLPAIHVLLNFPLILLLTQRSTVWNWMWQPAAKTASYPSSRIWRTRWRTRVWIRCSSWHCQRNPRTSLSSSSSRNCLGTSCFLHIMYACVFIVYINVPCINKVALLLFFSLKSTTHSHMHFPRHWKLIKKNIYLGLGQSAEWNCNCLRKMSRNKNSCWNLHLYFTFNCELFIFRIRTKRDSFLWNHPRNWGQKLYKHFNYDRRKKNDWV